MTLGSCDIISAPTRDFAFEVAKTQDALREAQLLRYQVFCAERGILPSRAGQATEADEYDNRSHHILLRHLSTGEAVGTVRLVLGCEKRPTDSLPIQRYCNSGVLRGLPMRSSGEISRFALSKQRRVTGSVSDSLLRLGLMQGVLHVSKELGLTHWCALMERSLLRLLRITGVQFVPVGPMVEAYGLRQPSIAAIDQILNSGKCLRPDIYRFVSEPRATTWNYADSKLAA